jgi:hypothetical protein
MGRAKDPNAPGRRLALDVRPPAAGEPWRAVLDAGDVDADLAHGLASAARFPAWDTKQWPPVDFHPDGYGWWFTIGARQVDPVEAVDVVDEWLAAFDASLGPEWEGARAWAWRSALETAA